MERAVVYLVMEDTPYEGMHVRGVFLDRLAADVYAKKLYEEYGNYARFPVIDWKDGETA